MKFLNKFLRSLVGVYAVLGIIANSVALGIWCFWISIAAGSSASAADMSVQIFKIWGVAIGIWILPTSAFLLTFLMTVNRLNGVFRLVSYWYSLVIFLISIAVLFYLSKTFYSLQWLAAVVLSMTIVAAVTLWNKQAEAEPHV